MRALVPAPPIAPPRTGLLATFRPETEAQSRWEGGFSYEAESCGIVTGARALCDNTERDATPGVGPIVTYDPIFLEAVKTCSAMSYAQRREEFDGRVRRDLEACGPRQLEAELWTGDIARAQDLPNPYLASPAAQVLTSGPAEALVVLQLLEAALADCGCGSRAVIHAPRDIVIAWAEGGALRREGAVITTINDTIIVSGAGYPGSGPSADGEAAGAARTDGAAWVYGSGLIVTRLGETRVFGADTQGIDPLVNTLSLIAQRPAAATFDPCCVVAAEIDAPMAVPEAS